MRTGEYLNHGYALSSFVAQTARVHQVRKGELRAGDHLYVITENSVYHLRAADEGWYFVSGGWFERNAVAPSRTRIVGCTWGGSVIKVDVIAAVGLSLEFGNRVTTSPIRRIILLRQGQQN